MSFALLNAFRVWVISVWAILLLSWNTSEVSVLRFRQDNNLVRVGWNKHSTHKERLKWMISKTVYLQRIFEHNTWHQSKQEEPPIDLSCIICHPATEEHLTPAFRNFWNFWIVLYWKGQTYTKYTCLYFQQVCEAKNKSERNYSANSLYSITML